jgi:endonuclease YncB( thermonuclease family)
MLMQLGKTRERAITQRQALVWGIIILLFPLCCAVSVGTRLYRESQTPEAAVADQDLDGEPGAGDEVAGGEESVGEDAPSEILEPTFTLTQPPAESSTPFPIPSSDLASCVPAGTKREIGDVADIIDGDSFTVHLDGEEYTVRYIGIDAPEIGEPHGDLAKVENDLLIFGETVIMVQDVSDTDEMNRLLRYVFVGDTFINYELVLRGRVLAENTPPDLACSDLFQTAEGQAIKANAGIWKPTDTEESGGGGAGLADCDCKGPDNLNCSDFFYKSAAQACYDICVDLGKSDYYNLDPNGNGKACDE